MQETTATLRTFSQDKYDAMEANIPYQEKHILHLFLFKTPMLDDKTKY
jgi:hypothetical protein